MAQESAVLSSPRKPSGREDAVRPALGDTHSTRSSLLKRLARRAILDRLESLEEGDLEIREGQWVERFGQASAGFPLRARLEVLDGRFWHRLAAAGSVGAGEAFARGWWTTDDLTAVIPIVARNPHLAAGVDEGFARVARPVRRLLHLLRANSRRGSRRNIAAHYDLSNDFFRLFLDPTLMYSCAVFPHYDSSLEEASVHKLDLVCRKLELGPDDEVIEIGGGWGGFAIHAARHYGARVVTTTISRAQHDLMMERVREAGLTDRITVLEKDYRDLPGALGRRFDKLVSIEMIEAVGYRHLDEYVRVCSDLLEPCGMGLIQAIVIADQNFDDYRRSVDFIQRYIFPGGMLPSLAAITDRLARVTDMRLFHLEDLTPHYARTLQHWRKRFMANRDRIAELGLSPEFQRLWEFYFCYCEGGFLERGIGNVQLLLSKPLNRRLPIASEV